jgi:hypothetical protein
MTIIALINFGSTFRKRMEAQAQEQEQAAAQAATTLLSEPELEPQPEPQPRKPPQLQPSGSEGHDSDRSNNDVAPPTMMAMEEEEEATTQALRHIPKANKGLGQQKRGGVRDGGGEGDVTAGRPAAASGSGLLPAMRVSPSIMLPGREHGHGRSEEEQAQSEFGFEDFGGGLAVDSNSSRGNMGSSTNGDDVTPTDDDVTPAKGDGRLWVTSQEYIATPTETSDANVTLARDVTPTDGGDVTPKERVEVNVTLAEQEQADVTSTSYLYYTQLSEGNIEGNIVPALEVTVTDFDLEPSAEGLRAALVILCDYYTDCGIEDPLLAVVRNALYGTDFEQSQLSSAIPMSKPEQIELKHPLAPEIIASEPNIESEIESGNEGEGAEISLDAAWEREPTGKENEWENLLLFATSTDEIETQIEEPEPEMEVVEVSEVTNSSPSPTATEFNVTPTPTSMLPSSKEQNLDLGTIANTVADDATEGNNNKELEITSEAEAEADVTFPTAPTTSDGNINNDGDEDNSSTSAGSESSGGNADGTDDATDGDGEGAADVTSDVEGSSSNGGSARQFILALLARPENKGGLAANVLSKGCIEQFNVTPKYLRKLLSTMKSEGLIAQHGRGQPYFLAEAEAEADTPTSATPASEMATVTTAESAEAEVGG